MSVVGHANWWCSTCGARGSGNGVAYADWLRGHACGTSAPAISAPTVKANWGNATDVTIHGYPSVNHHQTTPGRMTFTTLTTIRGAS